MKMKLGINWTKLIKQMAIFLFWLMVATLTLFALTLFGAVVVKAYSLYGTDGVKNVLRMLGGIVSVILLPSIIVEGYMWAKGI